MTKPELEREVERLKGELAFSLIYNKSTLKEFERLKGELAARDSELYEARDRILKADRKLEWLGFRHCDIAACNCGSYHRWETDKNAEWRDAATPILHFALQTLRRTPTKPMYKTACRLVGEVER